MSNLLADERTLLDEFVDSARQEVADSLDGLSDEQARQRLVPSLTTPLGLVKHLTFVEQVWFEVALLGRARAELGLPEDVDSSFAITDTDTVASVLGRYREVCATSREIAARYGLDDVAQHNRRSPMSLRWVYLHLIRELNRHAGHADILREQLLAADGSES
ncbi:MAG TPA: DinB family protein [Marmoricola sp.]|jgi:uncharacterized damage-inducible protein DinB|nr:DinB family protein [Marmoricola sp.]